MPLFIPFGESPFMYVSINKPLSGLGWRVKILDKSIKYRAEKNHRF